jgi:hypothetical protein
MLFCRSERVDGRAVIADDNLGREGGHSQIPQSKSPNAQRTSAPSKINPVAYLLRVRTSGLDGSHLDLS